MSWYSSGSSVRSQNSYSISHVFKVRVTSSMVSSSVPDLLQETITSSSATTKFSRYWKSEVYNPLVLPCSSSSTKQFWSFKCFTKRSILSSHGLLGLSVSKITYSTAHDCRQWVCRKQIASRLMHVREDVTSLSFRKQKLRNLWLWRRRQYRISAYTTSLLFYSTISKLRPSKTAMPQLHGDVSGQSEPKCCWITSNVCGPPAVRSSCPARSCVLLESVLISTPLSKLQRKRWHGWEFLQNS